MSLSRSPQRGHRARPRPAAAWSPSRGDPALDSLSDNSRRSCETVRRPCADHTSPLNKPEAAPVLGVHRQHRVEQHARGVALDRSPRARAGAVRWWQKWISLVSWIASTWRPPAAATVPSLQLSITRSVVTLALPRKRWNCTSRARMPLASRRRQTSLLATMRSTSAAPLYRDDDPRTDPMTSQFAPACRHPCQKPKCRNRNHMNSSIRESHTSTSSQLDAPHQMCACPRAFAGTTAIFT